MPEPTQNSSESGENRRRRSRGGQNRNNNSNHRHSGSNDYRDNNQSRGRESEGRQQNRSGGNPGRQGGNQGRHDELRPRGASSPARRYSQPKLTFWQKVLKAVGLYKQPQQDEHKPSQRKENDASAQKSSSRNDRSKNNASTSREQQSSGQERSENRRESGNRERRGGNVETVGSSRVYVGNLSYDVSENDLQELFKGVGALRNVEIIYNRSTHRSKGYGFVEMVSIDDAKRSVVVLHDQPFMGRKLNVSGALHKGYDSREEKEERSDRPSTPTLAPLPKTVQEEAQEIAAANGQAATPLSTHLPAGPHAPEVVAATQNVEAVGAPQVIVDAVQHQVEAAVEEPQAGQEKSKQSH